MKEIVNRLIAWENSTLSSFACHSSDSKGRPYNMQEEEEYRLAYQKDRDRIIHSKQFRRLKGKTQVFLFPIGDHYRTRLTHTLEVSQISRTIARALMLNEDLAEAAALGHDLGHTPFGHLGEMALNKLVPGGFHHAVQSTRIAKQLNLTFEVIDGIEKHSKGKGPILDDQIGRYAKTLEGQIVRVADIIAYLNHDLDDAVRAGILNEKDIPLSISEVLGQTRKEKLNTLVTDVILSTLKKLNSDTDINSVKRLHMSEHVLNEMDNLRTFLFKSVYESEIIRGADFDKVTGVCSKLYEYFINHPELLIEHMELTELYDSVEKVACDFISGMSDNYALLCYQNLFLPKPWLSEEIFNLRK